MQKSVPGQWQGNRSQAVVVSVGEAQGILTPFYTVDGNPCGGGGGHGGGTLLSIFAPHFPRTRG